MRDWLPCSRSDWGRGRELACNSSNTSLIAFEGMNSSFRRLKRVHGRASYQRCMSGTGFAQMLWRENIDHLGRDLGEEKLPSNTDGIVLNYVNI